MTAGFDATALTGGHGGAWAAETHATLYPANLNGGLVRFLVDHVAPRDFMEFGSGQCLLANAVAAELDLNASYCIEPVVVSPTRVDRGVRLLNIDAVDQPTPAVLDRKFDLVLSIEVAEHVALDRHEALFDFLVSRAGRTVVFSGARPGQGGHGHIAERPEAEWRNEFVRRGLIFDEQATLRARAMCDAKNINHRRNLQVFQRPTSYLALDRVEEAARPYLRDITALVQQAGGWLDGNLFYVDMAAAIGGMPEDNLKEKRRNLLEASRAARHVLEIGFNAGHSALLMLLANPDLRVTVVDLFDYPYARTCLAYLQAMFPGRITAHAGDSTQCLGLFDQGQFDLVHLDGGKAATIEADLALLAPLVSRDHLLVIDDIQNAQLAAIVDRHEAAGLLRSGPFDACNRRAAARRWTHRLVRFGSSPSLTDDILRDVGTRYADTDFASIYTKAGDDGCVIGQDRARSLIDAVRTAEEDRIPGAFVETGVAAGHSSVIAALAASRFCPRDFYLFDTFEGFGDLPIEHDLNGVAIGDYDLARYRGDDCAIDTVRRRMMSTGLPADRLFMVKGPVEQTVPAFGPRQIGILRLDVDLYEPTRVALDCLFDAIVPGGFLIVDDYGHWQGCKRAVDEFFAARGMSFAGEQIDYTCFMMRLPR